jgi:hypothetical protein
VKFVDVKPSFVNEGTVPRLVIAQVYSQDLNETINGRPGSGVVRPLEKSARAKGVEILLNHKLTKIIRENPASGKVLGITARVDNKDVNIQAKKGVIIATGGQAILGLVGVFVFFTISGYLVSQSFATTHPPIVFLAKRALRIFPGLIACLLVFKPLFSASFRAAALSWSSSASLS